jgi:hypothetical protein
MVNQDDARDIRRYYLEAALRVDAKATGVARELGLTRLADAIENDREALAAELKELVAWPLSGRGVAAG